jgi:hypothetical protein
MFLLSTLSLGIIEKPPPLSLLQPVVTAVDSARALTHKVKQPAPQRRLRYCAAITSLG